MSKPKPKNCQERLRACRKEYEQIKARIREVGFICEGSLVERRLPCGNPNCRCHKDPANLHGPYYQLSWKEKGKTRTRLLSPQEAQLYREWIDNRRQLVAIKDDMLAISETARNCILSSEIPKNTRPKGHKKSKASKKKTT